MTVSKLSKTIQKDPESFIANGGSPATVEDATNQTDEVRMTLRCPKSLMDKLDARRKQRPGRLSRNQAIVELMDEKLNMDN